MPDAPERLRLDKWLWAARFYKTRSIAKSAIEGGKVQLHGHRVKVSKEIVVGDVIQLRQGWDEKTVMVAALSNQRRSAPEAQALYEETADSVAKRVREAAARKAAGGMLERPVHRPTKKQRRQIHRFREGMDD